MDFTKIDRKPVCVDTTKTYDTESYSFISGHGAFTNIHYLKQFYIIPSNITLRFFSTYNTYAYSNDFNNRILKDENTRRYMFNKDINLSNYKTEEIIEIMEVLIPEDINKIRNQENTGIDIKYFRLLNFLFNFINKYDNISFLIIVDQDYLNLLYKKFKDKLQEYKIDIIDHTFDYIIKNVKPPKKIEDIEKLRQEYNDILTLFSIEELKSVNSNIDNIISIYNISLKNNNYLHIYNPGSLITDIILDFNLVFKNDKWFYSGYIQKELPNVKNKDKSSNYITEMTSLNNQEIINITKENINEKVPLHIILNNISKTFPDRMNYIYIFACRTTDIKELEFNELHEFPLQCFSTNKKLTQEEDEPRAGAGEPREEEPNAGAGEPNAGAGEPREEEPNAGAGEPRDEGPPQLIRKNSKDNFFDNFTSTYLCQLKKPNEYKEFILKDLHSNKFIKVELEDKIEDNTDLFYHIGIIFYLIIIDKIRNRLIQNNDACSILDTIETGNLTLYFDHLYNGEEINSYIFDKIFIDNFDNLSDDVIIYYHILKLSYGMVEWVDNYYEPLIDNTREVNELDKNQLELEIKFYKEQKSKIKDKIKSLRPKENKYYLKYLKYKAKYLSLKNKFK